MIIDVTVLFFAILGVGWAWRVWNERRRMAGLSEKERELLDLMKQGQAVMKRKDYRAQTKILKAVGALGTAASVPLIADLLSVRSKFPIWSDLLKGIVEGAKVAEPEWRDGVFRALKQGLEDPSTPDLFQSWPFVSWPAALMAVDAERALKVFVDLKLLVPGAPGFAEAVTAINESSLVVPGEVASQWLPAMMPDLNQQRVAKEYLLMLRAHGEHDLAECKRRLWEVVSAGGEPGREAAQLLLKAEGLPDPVWKLDSRVEELGLDQMKLAERTVWLVGNCFVFPTSTSGFERYAASSEADHLPEIVEALKEIGAPVTARCLQEWARLFGEEWPAKYYHREEMIDERMLEPQEHWDKVCAGAGELENVVLLNLRYELQHADEFERAALS